MSLSQARRQPQPNFLTDLLDPKLAERLAGVGILSTADWLKLTPKERGSIWGITRSAIKAIDAVIAAVRP